MKTASSLSLLILASFVPAIDLAAQPATAPATGGMVMSGALPSGLPPQASSVAETPAEPASPSIAKVDATAPDASASEPADERPPQQEPDFLQRSNLILAKLLENHRVIDPFGKPMDPADTSAAPVLADRYAEVEEKPQAVDSSSLKNALLSLPITGIYPQRQTIVIGARSFPVGGQFGMNYQELTIRLRFEGVRSGELFFKDMETREIASIPFNALPPEFEPLTQHSKPQTGKGIEPMNQLFIAN